MRIVRKTKAFILISVFIVIIVLEVHAHTYVPHLSITRVEDATAYMPYINGTRVFHKTFGYCSVDWLVAWHFKRPTPSMNLFYIYFFKINGSGSLLVQNLEITPQRIKTASQGIYHANAVYAMKEEVFYESGYTMVRVPYDIGYIDTYNVTFSLFMKVYAKTLVGYLPIEDSKIPINVTMIYRP